MDKSLSVLCKTIKHLLGQVSPTNGAFSFILLTGKLEQGKTTLLNQSKLTQHPCSQETDAAIFYNHLGLIVELGENWLNQNENLLTEAIKQLNCCHRHYKISGLILCLACNEALQLESSAFQEYGKSQAHLLNCFAEALSYPIETALFINKIDALAGFSEFYYSTHANDLQKPLGFTLENNNNPKQLLAVYQNQFDQLIETLGQQIITKLHPARSTLKRTLIREFPLQFTLLKSPIQVILQNIKTPFCRISAIYFTSAKQGGFSIDLLNKKIQHEYALCVQDRFPQSNNYRSYFIQDALRIFQAQTRQRMQRFSARQKLISSLTLGITAIIIFTLGYQQFKTYDVLDEMSKELLAYEQAINQDSDNTTAFYHLAKADDKINTRPFKFLSLPAFHKLEAQVHHKAQNKLQHDFFSSLNNTLEEAIINPSSSQTTRYQALKIYLMLAEPQHLDNHAVKQWFAAAWQNLADEQSTKKQTLLNKLLQNPLPPAIASQQLVSDTRNYLNALPAAYLYYSLAKNYFPQQQIPLTFAGFDLAAHDLPVYFTKSGFKDIIAMLPAITAKLKEDNWVLERQDLNNLQQQLAQAYCFDYTAWWQNFNQRTRPLHYQGYEQAQKLTATLIKTNEINKLIAFIQQQTSPVNNENADLFNQQIAAHFTALNLITNSSIRKLTNNMVELEKFFTTLSLLSNQDQAVFELTIARFKNSNQTDPLSTLYNKTQQFPAPIANWTKQIADDLWFIFINKSKEFLNKQWQQTIYSAYQTTIANRYPLTNGQQQEIALADFNHFFAPHGLLNQFVDTYLKPFLDTSQPQWQPKAVNGYILPVNADLLNELIRANVISNMFFPNGLEASKIEFSLQKISLDPVIANMQITLGNTTLTDNQSSDSLTIFNWPEANAKLRLNSIEGNHYELAETGDWAFFKLLDKVNVLADNNDSMNLQILFEINGNSGRYLLRTENQINPFSPGILTGFKLTKQIA